MQTTKKVIWVGDQKWEIVEIAIGIIFLFEIRIHNFFYTGSFEVPLEKNHPRRNCQFPPKIPIWPKSLLYKPSEKWLNPLPRVYKLWTFKPAYVDLATLLCAYHFYYGTNGWQVPL